MYTIRSVGQARGGTHMCPRELMNASTFRVWGNNIALYVIMQPVDKPNRPPPLTWYLYLSISGGTGGSLVINKQPNEWKDGIIKLNREV